MEELIEKLREAVKYAWTVEHIHGEVRVLNDIGKSLIIISRGLTMFKKVCLHHKTLAMIQAIAEKQVGLNLNPNFERHIPTDEDREEEITEMKDSIIDGVEGDR